MVSNTTGKMTMDRIRCYKQDKWPCVWQSMLKSTTAQWLAFESGWSLYKPQRDIISSRLAIALRGPGKVNVPKV
jgi:hypothetical protein